MTTTMIPTMAIDDLPLTAQDRCDGCGARAYVRALLPSGTELLFCGHHGTAHRAALLEAGAELRDETQALRVERGVEPVAA